MTSATAFCFGPTSIGSSIKATSRSHRSTASKSVLGSKRTIRTGDRTTRSMGRPCVFPLRRLRRRAPTFCDGTTKGYTAAREGAASNCVAEVPSGRGCPGRGAKCCRHYAVQNDDMVSRSTSTTHQSRVPSSRRVCQAAISDSRQATRRRPTRTGFGKSPALILR